MYHNYNEFFQNLFYRNLAEEYQVSWKEYWHFLNDFADFHCVHGLAKLEKYLEQRFIKQSYYCDKVSTITYTHTHTHTNTHT